jgi:hypothetical protein
MKKQTFERVENNLPFGLWKCVSGKEYYHKIIEVKDISLMIGGELCVRRGVLQQI